MPWRKRFLFRMDALTPWERLASLIAPHYGRCQTNPCGSRHSLHTMLRIFVMQHWFGYKPREMEKALHARTVLRRFGGLNRHDHIPDDACILAFHRLVESLGLTQTILGLTLGSGDQVASSISPSGPQMVSPL